MAVEEELDATSTPAVRRFGSDRRTTAVTAVPIGVDYDRIQMSAATRASPSSSSGCGRPSGCSAGLIGLASTASTTPRAFPERLEALDLLFTRRPDLRGRLTFVQIGVRQRSALGSYNAIRVGIDRRVAELNARHGVPELAPPVYTTSRRSTLASLVALYRLAQLLHRQLAARRDEPGCERVRGGERRRGRRARAERAGRRRSGACATP
jgi:trehalose-6-phosphate synthase